MKPDADFALPGSTQKEVMHGELSLHGAASLGCTQC